jgi:hypothetical protein
LAPLSGSCRDLKKAYSLSFSKRGFHFPESLVAAKKASGPSILSLKRGLEGPSVDVGSLLPPSLDLEDIKTVSTKLLHPQEGSIILDENMPSKVEDEGDYEIVKEDPQKKFHMCQKCFLLTYPQCPGNKVELGEFLLKKWSPKKIIVVQETHHQTEGQHLHAFLEFPSKKHIYDCRAFDWGNFHAHICKLKNAKTTWAAGVKYCSKEDVNPWIRGFDMEEYFNARKQKRKYLGMKLNAGMTLNELVEQFPEQRWCVPTLKKAEEILKAPHGKPIGWDRPAENLWICGPPRIGKSYWAHNGWSHPFYLKNQNKWWDGYQGEETVIIDDFRTPLLAGKLINWAGEYEQYGETKGGHVPLQHKRVIITSNYKIDEIFKGEEFAIEKDAIKARFPEVTIDPKTHELLPFFGDDWRAQMNIEALGSIHKPDWGILEERIQKREKWLADHPNWKNGKFFQGVLK